MSLAAFLARAAPFLVVISHLPIEEYLASRRPANYINETPAPTEVHINPPTDSPAIDKPQEQPIDKVAVSGVSQISAAGKACIPCGNDHFSTASSMLEESLRFAREDSVNNPEVIKRISAAEDELNAFERIDGASENVVKLPPKERELMLQMLAASREMRHKLKDIKDVPSLESTSVQVKEIKNQFRSKVFGMQLEKLPKKTRDVIKKTAQELVQSIEQEG